MMNDILTWSPFMKRLAAYSRIIELHHINDIRECKWDIDMIVIVTGIIRHYEIAKLLSFQFGSSWKRQYSRHRSKYE